MSILAKLRLVFNYGPELEEVLRKIRDERAAHERLIKAQNLSLCELHQQRTPGMHYAKHNCDYCKLLDHVDDLLGGVAKKC